MTLLEIGVEAVERGLLPDSATRVAIRRLCAQRLRDYRDDDFPIGATSPPLEPFTTGPIAVLPEKANQQHYELPPEFFAAFLGPHRKYSCCFWPDGDRTLAEAEAASLQETCELADLADGQEILELGCGWGSLSLWMAERFPRSRILAVSNSSSQKRWIDERIRERGIENLRVATADMNDFRPPAGTGRSLRFDRVVSVEMFEHMRNLDLLLGRIASWMHRDGKLFVHMFCHRDRAYLFETEGAGNWMGRHFFSGGMMPSADLLGRIDRDMSVVRHSTWNGRHYQKTAEAWLSNFDAERDCVMRILRNVYGGDASRWFRRWRVFFLAVAELFGYRDGTEWFVAHTLLEPSSKPR